jgi:hypothetical protein
VLRIKWRIEDRVFHIFQMLLDDWGKETIGQAIGGLIMALTHHYGAESADTTVLVNVSQ